MDLYTNFHFEKTYLQQVFSPSRMEIMFSDPVRICVCGGGQGHALVQDKEAVSCLTSLKIREAALCNAWKVALLLTLQTIIKDNPSISGPATAS